MRTAEQRAGRKLWRHRSKASAHFISLLNVSSTIFIWKEFCDAGRRWWREGVGCRPRQQAAGRQAANFCVWGGEATAAAAVARVGGAAAEPCLLCVYVRLILVVHSCERVAEDVLYGGRQHLRLL